MKMNYVAPELEVLEVMVEKGFEGSSDPNFGGGVTDPFA
jgi:hypothetical protein